MTSKRNKTVETVAEQSKEQVIYIGPTLKNGRLKRYDLFKGGTPAHFQDLFELIPDLRVLFVPVAELNSAEREIASFGTELNIVYKEIERV